MALVCFCCVEMEGSLWQFGKFHCFLYGREREGGGEGDLDGD